VRICGDGLRPKLREFFDRLALDLNPELFLRHDGMSQSGSDLKSEAGAVEGEVARADRSRRQMEHDRLGSGRRSPIKRCETVPTTPFVGSFVGILEKSQPEMQVNLDT
jgi:hypothetical protein